MARRCGQTRPPPSGCREHVEVVPALCDLPLLDVHHPTDPCRLPLPCRSHSSTLGPASGSVWVSRQVTSSTTVLPVATALSTVPVTSGNGCPRIARIISQTFGVDTDKNLVHRVLAKHYLPAPTTMPRGAMRRWRATRR